MTVKLDHYWTIIPEKTEEYNNFIIKKFIPGVNKLHMHTVAAWYVIVGAYSEIIFESASNDLEVIEKALQNEKYQALKAELLNYVKNYKTKVLVKTGKNYSYSTDVYHDTIKFNQMWNLISGKKEEYGHFTTETFYPILEELGVTIAQEWEVLIGDSPSIICEGRAHDTNNLIKNLGSKEFCQAKREFKQYVENYESRILCFHIQKLKGYKSASYKLISG